MVNTITGKGGTSYKVVAEFQDGITLGAADIGGGLTRVRLDLGKTQTKVNLTGWTQPSSGANRYSTEVENSNRNKALSDAFFALMTKVVTAPVPTVTITKMKGTSGYSDYNVVATSPFAAVGVKDLGNGKSRVRVVPNAKHKLSLGSNWAQPTEDNFRYSRIVSNSNLVAAIGEAATAAYIQ